jgi:hypothetical protein
MAAGSTVAKLQFDLGAVKLLQKRNATFGAVLHAQQSADFHAGQVRARVFKFAFKELSKWRDA